MTAAAPIEVSILVNTFQKPRHLGLVLESIALQQADCRLEVIVSDDGSTDDTAAVVAAFAAHRLLSEITTPSGQILRVYLCSEYETLPL